MKARLQIYLDHIQLWKNQIEGYRYTMNKSKPMTDTTGKAKKMTPTGRKPSNPNLMTLPGATQDKQMCSVDASKVEVRMTVADAKVEACEPTDNVELFDSPESSQIKGAVYYIAERELRVTFKAHKIGDGEKTYKYEKFPLTEWEDFKISDSKGKFFSANIRPRFTGIKL